MDAGKGKSCHFKRFPSPRQSGGQKGCLRQLHFMRPFAPCFGKLVAGAQVYLRASDYCITAAVRSGAADRSLAVSAQDSGPSGSLVLSRKNFAFSASCRFIPAHQNRHCTH
jgi:hypothetical protein